MDNTDRRRRRKQQKVTLHDSEGSFLYPTLSTSNFTCLRNLSWVGSKNNAFANLESIFGFDYKFSSWDPTCGLFWRVFVEKKANIHFYIS